MGPGVRGAAEHSPKRLIDYLNMSSLWKFETRYQFRYKIKETIWEGTQTKFRRCINQFGTLAWSIDTKRKCLTNPRDLEPRQCCQNLKHLKNLSYLLMLSRWVSWVNGWEVVVTGLEQWVETGCWVAADVVWCQDSAPKRVKNEMQFSARKKIISYCVNVRWDMMSVFQSIWCI